MSFSHTQNEIRHKPILFLIIPFLFLFFFPKSINDLWQVIFPIMGSVIIAFVYVNDKMIYDDLGITFCNIWRHKYQVLWTDIILVEDTYENPRLSRGAPGRIVKIVYKNHKHKTSTAKYSYSDSAGLDEFLSFYYAKTDKQSLSNEN